MNWRVMSWGSIYRRWSMYWCWDMGWSSWMNMCSSWILIGCSRFVRFHLSSETMVVSDIVYLSVNSVGINVSVTALYSSLSITSFFTELLVAVFIFYVKAIIIRYRCVLKFNKKYSLWKQKSLENTWVRTIFYFYWDCNAWDLGPVNLEGKWAYRFGKFKKIYPYF